MISNTRRDQQHPQEREDRSVINQLISGEPTDYNLTELGRLRIRYHNFPGARELQKDLDLVLQRWGLTQEELFKKTISIHSEGSLHRNRSGEEQQDWS